MAQENPRKMLQLCAPPALTAAVKVAADREMMTVSEYVRRALIDHLRSNGVDPTVATDAAHRPSQSAA
jgi:hypothetical protein